MSARWVRSAKTSRQALRRIRFETTTAQTKILGRGAAKRVEQLGFQMCSLIPRFQSNRAHKCAPRHWLLLLPHLLAFHSSKWQINYPQFTLISSPRPPAIPCRSHPQKEKGVLVRHQQKSGSGAVPGSGTPREVQHDAGEGEAGEEAGSADSVPESPAKPGILTRLARLV